MFLLIGQKLLIHYKLKLYVPMVPSGRENCSVIKINRSDRGCLQIDETEKLIFNPGKVYMHIKQRTPPNVTTLWI